MTKPDDPNRCALTRRALLGTAVAGTLAAGGTAQALAAPPTPQQARQSTSTTRAAFDAADLAFNDGEGRADETNEAGLLSWQESYVMLGYVLMYRAHRDLYYLDKYVSHADRVLANRDSIRAVTDYRGLSLPVWRNSGVTVDGSAMHLVVDTGNITYPMTSFVRTVRATPELMAIDRYRLAADRHLAAVEAAVATHDAEWNNNTGVYVITKGSPYVVDGIETPVNMSHSLGRTLLDLWRLTGKTAYGTKVERMVIRWRKDFYSLSDDSIAWPHNHVGSWPYIGWTPADDVSVNSPSYAPNQRVSDTSHGTMCVSFAGLVAPVTTLTEDELVRMARTMTRHAITTGADGTLTVHERIDASRPDTGNPRMEIHVGNWLALAPFAEDDLVGLAAQLVDQNLGSVPGGALSTRISAIGHLNYMVETGLQPISRYVPAPPV